jgi:hypothetical protein
MLYLLAALLLASSLPQSELVLVKEGAAEYHRPHCEIVRNGIGVLAMTRAQAEGRKLKPHAACDPEKQPPPETSPADGAAPSPKKGAAVKPTYVFVDAAGKHYHRETCKRLGKAPKKMVLDEAGKKYWPCSVCRPPIRPRKR